MSYVIDSKTITLPNGFRLEIEIHPDDDPSPPDECDCEPEFFHADRGSDLRRKLNEEFSSPEKAYREMACGGPYKDPDGDWYYGVTEYRHGGSAFALCGDRRASRWPDQQWDVIALAGWLKISKKLRQDWGIFGKKGVEEKARKNAEISLKEWEAYCNGGYCGYVAKILDGDDEEINEDSCWGFSSSEYAMDGAMENVGYWKGQAEREFKPV